MGWAYEHLYDDLVDAIVDHLELEAYDIPTIKLDDFTKNNLRDGSGEAPTGTHTGIATIKSKTYKVEYTVKVMTPENGVDYEFGESMNMVLK